MVNTIINILTILVLVYALYVVYRWHRTSKKADTVLEETRAELTRTVEPEQKKPDPKARPYWEAFESALKDLQDYDVDSLAIVALCNDEDVHNVCAYWRAGPFEKSSMASVLQLSASLEYNQINSKEDKDDEGTD